MGYVRFDLPKGVVVFVRCEKVGEAAFRLKSAIWECMRHMPLVKYAKTASPEDFEYEQVRNEAKKYRFSDTAPIEEQPEQ